MSASCFLADEGTSLRQELSMWRSKKAEESLKNSVLDEEAAAKFSTAAALAAGSGRKAEQANLLAARETSPEAVRGPCRLLAGEQVFPPFCWPQCLEESLNSSGAVRVGCKAVVSFLAVSLCYRHIYAAQLATRITSYKGTARMLQDRKNGVDRAPAPVPVQRSAIRSDSFSGAMPRTVSGALGANMSALVVCSPVSRHAKCSALLTAILLTASLSGRR